MNTLDDGHDGVMQKITQLIGSKGRNVIDSNGNSLLVWAARQGHLRVVKFLVEQHEFSINNQNFEGQSALSVSVIASNEDVVRYLIRCGALVNLRDCRGESPLHYAAALGKVEICRILCEEGGACKEIEDDGGDTPLHFAVRDERLDVVEYLLYAGADGDHPNQDNESPYQLAKLVGSEEMKDVFSSFFDAKSVPSMGNLSLHNYLFSPQTPTISVFPTMTEYPASSLGHSSVWQDDKGHSFPKRLTPNANLPGGCISRWVNV